jgi:PAS domain S-box-containing protein
MDHAAPDSAATLEARLCQSNRRLERALEAMNGIVYDWNLASGRVERSGAIARLLGIENGDLAATPEAWAERVHPDDKERFWSALDKALADRQPFELEYRLRRADGSYAQLWERTLVQPGPDGNVSHVYGVAIDVGQRKRMEAALAESETRFRTFLEAEPQCVKVLDREGRLLHMNPAGLAMIEVDGPVAVLGQPVEQILLPEHRPAFRAWHARVLDGLTGTLDFEIEGVRGTRRWMRSVAAPLRDPTGQIIGVIAVSDDITARRRHDDRLQVQAEILETMAEGVALTDDDALIRYTNRAFDEMFGYQRGELAGRSAWALSAAPKSLLLRLRQAEEAGGRGRIEFDAVRRGNRRFRAAMAVARLESAGKRHWIGVLQDVTERKLLEQELLEISNREQTRIGHDLHDGLGQELTAIALFLQGLRARLEHEAPGTLAELDIIKDLANRAIESTRMMARGLSPIVLDNRGLAEALRALASRRGQIYGLDISVDIEDLPEQDIDASTALQLYRIAQEALTNVARHANATHASVSLHTNAGQIVLRIQDDGNGLPESQGDAQGMGLKIMRYRAEVLDGEFVARRRAQGGTVVLVSCPVGTGLQSGRRQTGGGTGP